MKICHQLHVLLYTITVEKHMYFSQLTNTVRVSRRRVLCIFAFLSVLGIHLQDCHKISIKKFCQNEMPVLGIIKVQVVEIVLFKTRLSRLSIESNNCILEANSIQILLLF